MEGYSLKPGLDTNLFAGLEVLSAVYEGDMLKVTGTFNEQALFGGRNDWNIYLPAADKFEGRFYQRVYPFNTNNLPDDLKFSSSSGGYQVEYYELFKINGAALAADISRTIAANYYGLNRDQVRNPQSDDYIYGYAYGGSGGSPAAIDIMEDKTYNVWDGAVPFVIIGPYTYSTGGDTIPVFRNLLLRGLGSSIWDAMRPGGIGREAMYATLTPLQKEALSELELLGLRWEDIGNVGTDLTAPGGPTLPAGYVEDFWTKPGYTGTDSSLIGQYFRDIRGTTIDGTVMTDELLAKIAWHRHRNFDPKLGLFMYDHLNRFAKAGPVESSSRWTGDIQRKGMLVQNMQDGGAIYVTAEWYKRQVAAAGKSDDFRVYVQEAAGHLDGPISSGGDVPYLGLLEQALRDLSAWVEEDKQPAPSTVYDFPNNQIVLKEGKGRLGLQPTITVSANGGKRAEVAQGDRVRFNAKIEPAVAGDVVTRVEWNPGTPDAPWTDVAFTAKRDGSVAIRRDESFQAVGTYFPAFRVTAYRNGAPAEGIVGRLMNQTPARVVVKDQTRPEASLAAPTSTGPFRTLDIKVDATDAVGLAKITADVYRGSKLVQSTQTPLNGETAASHTASVTVPDGDYTVKYSATDAAGNVSKVGSTRVTVDTTAPTVEVKSGKIYTTKVGTAYSLISFKFEDKEKVDRVTVNGVTTDLPNLRSASLDRVKPGVAGAQRGANELIVYDVAGNSATFTFTLN
ncbi:hypothetical protein SAMN05216418_1807 [Microbacterium enclense]|uniref:Ig-like domain-containing protein n=2 Tax=Microbacterium enclense TaxID=993073 RepID=A0A1G6JG09_9MICO|nr:hypothetical protein AS029_07740 [Microbacterium enclense]SDC17375.1 hypothetical protein SAMN05216418_1807 [Microbacterium enclense]